MLTRSGVAKRLGKSIATVRRMENEELHPVRDALGVHRFSEDEVEQLARSASTSTGRRPGIPLMSRTSRNSDAEFTGQTQELAELRQKAAQLEYERETDRRWFGQELEAIERRANERAERRERTAQSRHAKHIEEQRLAAREAAELAVLRCQLSDALESLSRRQLAQIDPSELEDILRFIADGD